MTEFVLGMPCLYHATPTSQRCSACPPHPSYASTVSALQGTEGLTQPNLLCGLPLGPGPRFSKADGGQQDRLFQMADFLRLKEDRREINSPLPTR